MSSLLNWLKTDGARLITGTEMLSGHGCSIDNISLPSLHFSGEIAILINQSTKITLMVCHPLKTLHKFVKTIPHLE